MTGTPQGRSSTGPALRHATSEAMDEMLIALAGHLPPGCALTAVGALGRYELVPGSDLDLVFLHEPGQREAPKLAEALWYSIWDSPWSLDHSIRTPDEALGIARSDLKAALGLLDLRYLAGDEELVSTVRTSVRSAWVRGARQRLPELFAAAGERAQRAGELAFLLEPDLKESRGGLRDGLIPRQVAAAQIADLPGADVAAARETILDARTSLHNLAVSAGRKPSDRLLLQDQDAVAADLGYGTADELMLAVAGAARTTAFAVDAARRRVQAWAQPARTGLFRRAPARQPVAPGLVSQAGQIVLAADVDPATDPTLPLRAGRAAAETALPLSEHTLARLAEAPSPAEPWTDAVRDALVALLGAGAAAVPVIESLDTAGVWERFVPDWSRVRSRPQRNAFHRFTVDRHLLETAAEAAAFTREVARPDLLLLAGLLHDIGKGWPGEDHTDAGIREMPGYARRMGMSASDGEILTALVRCHILMAELATTRDTADPATAALLAAQIGSREALELLRWLTEADSLATGPAMWSRWKAGLVGDLFRRTTAVLAGSVPEPAPSLTGSQQTLLDRGQLSVDVGDGTVTVAAPDQAGLLATVVGVLSLQRLDVRALDASTHGDAGLVVASVAPRFGGELPDPVLLRDELARALSGQLDVATLLAERSAAYPVPARALLAPPRVLWDDLPTGDATVVEVRAPDAPGLLGRIASALSGCGLAVHTARCTTLGAEAIDAFYVTEPGGAPVPQGDRRVEVTEVLLAVA